MENAHKNHSKGRLIFWISALAFLLVACTRLMPHLWNFTPIAAMVLFGAFYFKKWRHAMLIPLGCLFLSDVIMELQFQFGLKEYGGFYKGLPLIYFSFFLIGLMGRTLRNGSFSSLKILSFSFAGSIVFYLVSNFGVWLSGMGYPLTLDGLMNCYYMAIPFLRNQIMGDLFYNAVFFGAFFLLANRFPALQRERS